MERTEVKGSHLKSLFCSIFGHKWTTEPVPLPCGCSDTAWACLRCGARSVTPWFRRWGCSRHALKEGPWNVPKSSAVRRSEA